MVCVAIALGIRAAGAEILYAAPATFPCDLPVAELSVRARGGAAQRLRFLIDSGSNRSVLFPSSGLSASDSLDLYAGNGKLGPCEFAQVKSGEMSADGLRFMRGLGVAGALGIDFLRTHDVYLDYGRKEIALSGEIPAGEDRGDPSRISVGGIGSRAVKGSSVHGIDLVEQDEHFYAPVTVEPDTACLMALDTGTGESSLDHDAASGLKGTGAVKRIAGFQGRSTAASEKIGKIAIGDNPPLRVRLLVSDDRGPILGGSAFAGHWLYLQFRLSRASYR